MRNKTTKILKSVIITTCILAYATMTGCATQTNKDPLEGLNRGIYKVNDVADKALIKPVATAYKTVTPSPIRTGLKNFFNNLGSITTVINDILQLKLAYAFTDAGRFVINSTFGLAGFIDVAGMDKIENHQEDFGQTLGYWGVGNGAYLVLPLFGPSSLRDATGHAVDTYTTDPLINPRNIGQVRLANQLTAAKVVVKRAELLDANDLVDEASLDPYAFTRDAYLQRRASLVQDGKVPKDLIKDDFYEDDTDPATPDTAKAPAAEAAPETPEPASTATPPATDDQPATK